MRVGIDAHMVGSRETGNETYIKGLIDGFKANPQDVELLVYGVNAPWTEPDRHLRFQRLLSSNPYARLGVELPLRSLVQRLDALHVTYVAPVWSSSPTVLTVHDICYATNPEWFSERDVRMLSAQVPRSIKAAAHIVTDSNASRNAIIDRYAVAPEKISSIPLGPGGGAMSLSAEEARKELRALSIPNERPYLLAVGNLQPRKNLVRLVEAFTTLVARGHDIALVVVGPTHYRAADTFQAAARMSDRVLFTGYVTDRQLAACYRCSTVLVFPSLYEGFGLPSLEAMSHGVPVASSDTGSLPEVSGDAAIYFDPLSAEAMADSIEKVLDDDELRNRLSTAGRERAKEFSWKKTAALTYEIYQQIAR